MGKPVDNNLVRISASTEILGTPVTGVDSVPPAGPLAIMAVQHVLTMYAGAITVPLLVASALHLSVADTAYLISSDLLACGLVTLLQCLGIGNIGIRMPVIMGVTVVGVMPAISIASEPSLGLQGAYGASIAAGIIIFVLMPIIGRLTVVLTPIVTGTTLLLIGLSLMGVAIDWAAGGRGDADFGASSHLALAGISLFAILFVARFGRGLIKNCAVLIGMAVGFLTAAALGQIDFSPVGRAAVVGFVSPFHFGAPRFELVSTLSMVIVLLVTVVESSGMLKALGIIIGRPVDRTALTRGLRADAVGAVVGGAFNSFPYTSYSSNLALVQMTGVRSRFVCVAAGFILIALAIVPKLSAIIAVIPPSVLGGASIVLFGMVAAAGMRGLADADLGSGSNGMIAGVSLGVGMIPITSAQLFTGLPKSLEPILSNGVLLGTVTAIALNLIFNGLPSQPNSGLEPAPAPFADTDPDRRSEILA